LSESLAKETIEVTAVVGAFRARLDNS